MKTALMLLVACRLVAQTCALSGSVTNHATSKPIAGAKVYLNPREGPAYLSKTDHTGAFCFEKIAPGSYQVLARHSGFIDQVYGAHPGEQQGIQLTVTADGNLPEAKISLYPGAAITGSVLHADGQPAAGVDVALMRASSGSNQADQDDDNVQGSTTADDQGAFRFANLHPGKYLLRAEMDSTSSEMFVPEFLTATGEHASEGEVGAYFPSALQANDAKVIAIKEGEEVSGLTINLRKVALRRVTGQLPKGLMIGGLRLDRIGEDGMSIPVPVNPDGSFERGGVPAGLYNLSFQNESSAVSGSVRVDLTSADATGLTLEPQKGFSVRVTVRLERNGALTPASDAFVVLENLAGGHGGATHTTGAGEYEIGNLLPGRYQLMVQTPNAPHFLKRMTIAGKAASPDDLELREEPSEPIDVVLSANFAEIGGRITETASEAVTALLVDANPRDGKIEIKRRAQCDQNGSFLLERVPPGNYLLYAIEDFDESRWGSPEVAGALQSKHIEIKEGETVQVDAKLTTAASWNMATERFLK